VKKIIFDEKDLTQIYEGSPSYLELMKKLSALYEKQNKAKEIPERLVERKFINSAKSRAKGLGLVKEHHHAKYSFRLWNENRLAEFTRAVRKIIRERKKYDVLLKDFPELGSANIVYFTIQSAIPGGIKGIRDAIAAVGSIELDTLRDALNDTERGILDCMNELYKTKPVLRVGDVAEVVKSNKDSIRGIMVKLAAQGFFVNIPGEHHLFFNNSPNFYTPKELMKFISTEEQNRIANVIHMGPITTRRLAQQLYGQEKVSNAFLSTYLTNLTERGLLEIDSYAGEYLLTKKGSEFGIDATSIQALDITILENKFLIKDEEHSKPFRSLSEVRNAVIQDGEDKAVNLVDISDHISKGGFKFLTISEILFGNQNTDVALLEKILLKSEPDFAIVSGLVQGTFTARNVKRQNELAQPRKLYKIGSQISAASQFLNKLDERTKGPICIALGDDDLRIAEDYADIAQLNEGKTWTFGVNYTSLTAELQRRINIREYHAKRKIQFEIILPYQYRIRRGLKNAKEVFKEIGVKKSEYRLIMEILILNRAKQPYPEIYRKVVDVDALLGGSKYGIVTPDSLILKVGDRTIQFVHNTNFSDVTQYVDPLFTSEKIMRHFMSRDYQKLPWMLLDGHQEMFYGTYFQNHWVMCLPGMQNSLDMAMHRKKTIVTRVLQSKSLRQNTFRKDPATPGAVEIEVCTEGGIENDGRIRLRFFNDKIVDLLDREKNKKHKQTVIGVLTDLQFGSPTMQPELVIKYLDYLLYTRGARLLRGNGDWLQGFIYPGFPAESRTLRMVSVDAQQRFTNELLVPLIVDAPHLEDVAFWQGNHEWGIWSNALTGQNALYFMETALQRFIDGMKKAGKNPKLKTASAVSRIIMARTTNPMGDRILFPYFAEVVDDWFKIAYTHQWLPYGGGRTPVDQPRRWVSNMANAAGDINALIGGDKHSLWLNQEAGKILIQLPAAATQSGYELARGLMSTVMFALLIVDNRTGFTVEFVPWQFLTNYKCVSKLYKGKDDQLILPSEDSVDYRNGKYSPYIEKMIDSLTYYKKM